MQLTVRQGSYHTVSDYRFVHLAWFWSNAWLRYCRWREWNWFQYMYKYFKLIFLLHLGSLDEFLKTYVEKFKFATISSEEWKEYFLNFFHKQVHRSLHVGFWCLVILIEKQLVCIASCISHLTTMYMHRWVRVSSMVWSGRSGYTLQGCHRTRHSESVHLEEHIFYRVDMHMRDK